MNKEYIEVNPVKFDKLPSITFYQIKPYTTILERFLGSESLKFLENINTEPKLEEILTVFDEIAKITGAYLGISLEDLINRIKQKRINFNDENRRNIKNTEKKQIENDIRYTLTLYNPLRKYKVNNSRVIESEEFLQLETSEELKYYLGSTKFNETEIIFPQNIPMILYPTQNIIWSNPSETSLGQIYNSLPAKSASRIDFKVK